MYSAEDYLEMTKSLDQGLLAKAFEEKTIEAIKLSSKEFSGNKLVADINIDSKDRIYSLSNGFLVHNCSFCKEAALARTYTQMDIFESYGEFMIQHPDTEELVKVNSKAKVKFFDTVNHLVVYGPIQVAISNGFPIHSDTIRRLVTRESFRVLSE